MANSPSVPIVSVVSLKGGVGKTSIALGLASAGLARDLRTVVIDLDPQGHATTVLDPADIRFTANDILIGSYGDKPRDALAISAWGPRVRVLASEPGLEHRNHPDDGIASEHRLRTAISKLKNADLIVIDTPPSLAALTRNALAASDLALVVTEPTMFALSGTQQTVAAVDMIRQEFNLRLRISGIVVNRVRPRSAEHRFRLDELIAAYRDLVVDPVLPERTEIARAQSSCLPIHRWPTSGARETARTFATYLDQLLVADRARGKGPFARTEDPNTEES